jgi:hypothetical protein
MLLGRIAGDGLAIWSGALETSGGAGLVGTGIAACGTGILCFGGAPAIAAGGVIAGYGVGTISSGLVGVGTYSGMYLSRRTEHAQQRAEEGRPIGTAWQDAQKAGKNNVLIDTNSGYYIVTGPKGRVSVFLMENGELKIQTGIRTTADSVFKKLEAGTYENLSEEQYAAWQQLLNDNLK